LITHQLELHHIFDTFFDGVYNQDERRRRRIPRRVIIQTKLQSFPWYGRIVYTPCRHSTATRCLPRRISRLPLDITQKKETQLQIFHPYNDHRSWRYLINSYLVIFDSGYSTSLLPAAQQLFDNVIVAIPSIQRIPFRRYGCHRRSLSTSRMLP